MARNGAVDPIAQMHANVRARQNARGPGAPIKPNYLKNARYPLSFVTAVLLGILVGVIGRYCQYHMLGMNAQPDDPDLQLIMDNIFAGLVAWVISNAVETSTREHMLAQMGGAWVVILLFHNLSHWAPEQMTQVFSYDYVKQVRADTAGDSILFRGQEFFFGDGPVKITINR